MITQTFTKPLWSFNTEGSLSRADVGIYVSFFVVFAWFDFIFPWGSFWSLPRLVWLEELPFHDAHFAQGAITGTSKCRVHENEQKWISFQSLTKQKDQSPE